MSKIAEITTENIATELAEIEARAAALRAEQELRAFLPAPLRLADELHRKNCDDHKGMNSWCNYYQEKEGVQARKAYVSVAEKMLEISDEKTILAIMDLAKEL